MLLCTTKSNAFVFYFYFAYSCFSPSLTSRSLPNAIHLCNFLLFELFSLCKQQYFTALLESSMSFLTFLSHSRHSKMGKCQRRKCIRFKSRLGNSTSINAYGIFLLLTVQRFPYFNGIQEATLSSTSNGEATAVPMTRWD